MRDFIQHGVYGGDERQHAHSRHLPINLLHNPEYASTNSFMSALVALCHARGQLLMVKSDVVYDDEIIRRMVESAAPYAFAIDRHCYSEEPEKIAVDPEGRVVQLAKTIPAADAAGCSLDLYRVNPGEGGEVWARMLDSFRHRPGAAKRLFEDFLDHALLALSFACVETDALDWYEIDTVAELCEAQDIFIKLDSEGAWPAQRAKA